MRRVKRRGVRWTTLTLAAFVACGCQTVQAAEDVSFGFGGSPQSINRGMQGQYDPVSVSHLEELKRAFASNMYAGVGREFTKTFSPYAPQQQGYIPPMQSYGPPPQYHQLMQSYGPPYQYQQPMQSYSPPSQHQQPMQSYSPPSQHQQPMQSYSPPSQYQQPMQSYSPPSQYQQLHIPQHYGWGQSARVYEKDRATLSAPVVPESGGEGWRPYDRYRKNKKSRGEATRLQPCETLSCAFKKSRIPVRFADDDAANYPAKGISIDYVDFQDLAEKLHNQTGLYVSVEGGRLVVSSLVTTSFHVGLLERFIDERITGLLHHPKAKVEIAHGVLTVTDDLIGVRNVENFVKQLSSYMMTIYGVEYARVDDNKQTILVRAQASPSSSPVDVGTWQIDVRNVADGRFVAVVIKDRTGSHPSANVVVDISQGGGQVPVYITKDGKMIMYVVRAVRLS